MQVTALDGGRHGCVVTFKTETEASTNAGTRRLSKAIAADKTVAQAAV